MFVRSVALALMLIPLLPSGQQAVPPPPKPPDAGPTYEATMQFIADKAADQGVVRYTKHFDDSSGNSLKDNSEQYDMRPLTWDKPTCAITYHPRIVTNGVVTFDHSFSRSLADVTKIEMIDNLAAYDNQEMVSNGITSLRISYIPALYAVHLSMRSLGGKNPQILEFRYLDASVADRVAKAFLHAVELCGGGNKDPF